MAQSKQQMDGKDGGLFVRSKEVTKLTQTAILLTKRKFCSHCQSYKLLEGGMEKRTKANKRWMCAGCVERKTNSSAL